MSLILLALLALLTTGQNVPGLTGSAIQLSISSTTLVRSLSARDEGVDSTPSVVGVLTSFLIPTEPPSQEAASSTVFGVLTSIPDPTQTISQGAAAGPASPDKSQLSAPSSSESATTSDLLPPAGDGPSISSAVSSDFSSPSSTSSTLVLGPIVPVETPDTSLPLTTPPAPTPDPSTPDPSTPDPSTPDPSTPDPSTPDPSTPDPSTPDPSTPDPSTPDPSTPDPSTPDPSTPDPSTPDPSTPDPSTPEPPVTSPDQPTTEPTQPESTQTESSAPTPSASAQVSQQISSTTSSAAPSCTLWDISVGPDQCQNTDDDDGDCDDIGNSDDPTVAPRNFRRSLSMELRNIAGRIEYHVTTTSGSMNRLTTAPPQLPKNFVDLVARRAGSRVISTAGTCLLRSTFTENSYPRAAEYTSARYQAASRFFPVSLSNLPPPLGQQGPGCPIPVIISTSDVTGISTAPNGPTYRTTLRPIPTPWINSDHVYELSLLHEFFTDRLNVDPNAPSCNDFSSVFEFNGRLQNIWGYMPGDAHPDLAAMDQNINGAKADYFNSNKGSFPTRANIAAKTNAVVRYGIAAAAINHPVFIHLFQQTHQRMYDAFAGIDATISACGIQVPAPTWASAYSVFVTSWLSDAGNRASSRASAVYSDIAVAGVSTSDFVAVYPPASFMLSSTAMASLNLNNPPAPVKRDDVLCQNTVIPITVPASPTAAQNTVIPITVSASPTAASNTVSVPVITPGAPLKITGVPDDIPLCSLEGGCPSLAGAVSTIFVSTP